MIHENGYPVEKVYEDKVVSVSTYRFEQLIHEDNYKHEKFSEFEEGLISKMQESEIRILDDSIRSSQVFDSIASYEPIAKPSKSQFKRPSFIKKLNIDNMESHQSPFSKFEKTLDKDAIMSFSKSGILLDFKRYRSYDDIYLPLDIRQRN